MTVTQYCTQNLNLIAIEQSLRYDEYIACRHGIVVFEDEIVCEDAVIVFDGQHQFSCWFDNARPLPIYATEEDTNG